MHRFPRSARPPGLTGGSRALASSWLVSPTGQEQSGVGEVDVEAGADIAQSFTTAGRAGGHRLYGIGIAPCTNTLVSRLVREKVCQEAPLWTRH